MLRCTLGTPHPVIGAGSVVRPLEYGYEYVYGALPPIPYSPLPIPYHTSNFPPAGTLCFTLSPEPREPMPAKWILERTTNHRFPVRIRIEQSGRVLLAVRAQSAWPGPGQQIFCVREWGDDPTEVLEPVEQVPVANLSRVGRKLAVVLDRPLRKRCEFLVVHKPRADGTGDYEQIFFRTESGIRSHRSRTRLELRDTPGGVTIAIDTQEK